ncbi:TBC16 protein, partial [Climacteris rufus]|nr:TBC16 protein [Climacteris rufus]
MSLGRLLRRASSRASDLLALSPGAPSALLEGDIIYSKNNVCVHPPELLQAVGEHHPGYLCLYTEKDELLGATLILAWVPNARIERQDEEALRYVTPEGSPPDPPNLPAQDPKPDPPGLPAQGPEPNLTTQDPEPGLSPEQGDTLTGDGATPTGDEPPEAQPAGGEGERSSPRPAPWPRSPSGSPQEGRGSEQGLLCSEGEGSLELPADHGSRDSALDSDSDAFSSPFCLSPISEALGKSSSSVFLDSESSSASSLDTSAQFQENNGQAQSTRWDEQHKGFALEQVCGVFRVDLGQMRSLRLFFSDEACTCGQLVVASRESQYKIFHFHHGGLDKLAEVFQQWKYCTETQLKDQVPGRAPGAGALTQGGAVAGSELMPRLPAAEAHPEESAARRLDVRAWLRHLGPAGRVQEQHSLRKAIFFGGIDISIRGEVWPFLLHYYSYESTSEEREALRLQKRKEYFEIQEKRLSMSPEEQKEFWRQVQFTVDKDVVRTDRSNQFFRGEDNPNVETMRRILLNYAVFNPTIGYSQGMSDLVAPLLAEVLDESDTFWCFVGLMQNTIFISSPRDEDMEKQLLYLRELLRLMHPRFHQHLCALGEDGLQLLFCHRWILLCFKREFPEAEALRMWEACWAHYQTDYFHLFICVAIVVIYGDDVIEQQLPTDQMLLHFGNLAMHMNGELVLRKARSLLYQFHLLPRIPCSLHELCKLCGTGMWDSGFIPAVECSGQHPQSESCPYGGTVEGSPPQPGREGKRGLKARDVFAFRK